MKIAAPLIAAGFLFALSPGASAKPYALSEEFWGAIDVVSKDYCSKGNIEVACHNGGILDGLDWRFPIPEATLAGLVKLRGGKRTILLTIAADVGTYNIYTNAGSPTSPVDVILTINSAVKVGVGAPSLFTSTGWASGSTLRLVNNGYILGQGGNGGTGAAATQASLSFSPGNGNDGFDALDVRIPLTLDNTNGYIFGGGGGGGGGGSAAFQSSAPFDTRAGGGGGGGGAGGGAGNGGGDANDGGNYNGQNGTNGDTDYSTASNGFGGAGGLNFFSTVGGAGGDGGSWGNSGNPGGNGSPNYAVGGGSGGNPGWAIRLNGNGITWQGGNNGTQVKGNVA